MLSKETYFKYKTWKQVNNERVKTYINSNFVKVQVIKLILDKLNFRMESRNCQRKKSIKGTSSKYKFFALFQKTFFRNF